MGVKLVWGMGEVTAALLESCTIAQQAGWAAMQVAFRMQVDMDLGSCVAPVPPSGGKSLLGGAWLGGTAQALMDCRITSVLR